MNLIKVIAWYQILTGILAFIFLINSAIQHFNFFAIPLMILIIFLILFVIYSGYKMLKDPLIGIKNSVIAQLIQTFGFSIPGFIYVFSTSGFLSLFISDSSIRMNFINTIVTINIRFDKNIDLFEIEIFPIPILIIILLIIEGLKIEKENKAIKKIDVTS